MYKKWNQNSLRSVWQNFISKATSWGQELTLVPAVLLSDDSYVFSFLCQASQHTPWLPRYFTGGLASLYRIL